MNTIIKVKVMQRIIGNLRIYGSPPLLTLTGQSLFSHVLLLLLLLLILLFLPFIHRHISHYSNLAAEILIYQNKTAG